MVGISRNCEFRRSSVPQDDFSRPGLLPIDREPCDIEAGLHVPRVPDGLMLAGGDWTLKDRGNMPSLQIQDIQAHIASVLYREVYSHAEI